MGLLYAGLTHVGQKRKANQDAIHLGPEQNLFIVADGMGGHKAGEVASSMAVDLIPKYFNQSSKEIEPKQLCNLAILHANQSIKQKSDDSAEFRGMGTTVVLMYFFGAHLYLGNVGDSRCYMVQRQQLYQMSRDHSLIQEKLSLGIYDREAAAKDPQKNVLSRTVGFDDQLDTDVFTYKVCKYDLFLICSDGLHGSVNDADIVHVINQHLPKPESATQADLEKTVEALIKLANFNGGPDNISVILLLAK